jgi:hypothetical protein
MAQQNNRDPQEQQISPQRSNPGQQHHEVEEPVNKPPQPSDNLDTGVDTGAIQPGKTQGANLA